MTARASSSQHADAVPDIWRALSNPLRRRFVELLAEGPRTTTELAEAVPGMSRFAVMQHLGVLTDAGLVLVRRRGRYRVNHLNPTPLRRWYEQWVTPMADAAAAEMLSLERHIEKGDQPMSSSTETVRTVRITTELRFHASPERVFRAITEETLEWFPHTYGEDRTRAVIVEPFVGGRHFEDWGDGAGYLYGHVTAYDPPTAYATRGRVMSGTILDTSYELASAGDDTILAMTKVAVGPMTAEEAESIGTYGDIGRFEAALRDLIEG
jgi:DNA-binding transcriptional ArsR family regulator